MLSSHEKVRNVFSDKFHEFSFKRVLDVHELAGFLQEQGFPLDGLLFESLGSMLLCFGSIEVERRFGDRPPPITEEQKKYLANLNFMQTERNKLADDFKKKFSKQATIAED